jgi:type VII secretion integral membrane protein EccD
MSIASARAGAATPARIVVAAPGRHIEVALPGQAPVAELLPDLLRHAGEGLADQGQAHGGWVLRRPDGTALSVGESLARQGVRDGDVLHLVPALQRWPELEYDDVVDEIAANARRYGRGWDGGATRATGLGLSGGALLLGLVALARSAGSSGLVALGVAAALLIAAVLATRAYGDALCGGALGAAALPYAAVGGALLLRVRQPTLGAPHLLVASAALVLASVVALVGVGGRPRVFVAGTIAGLAGATGALSCLWLTAAGSAAIVLALLLTGVAAWPLVAIRLGRLPVPAPAPRAGPEPRPEHARLYAAVVRTDEILTGMLLGTAIAAAGSSLVLVRSGGVTGELLVGVAAAGLALRGRLFPTVRQRLPLLLSGALGLLILLAGMVTGQRLAGPVLACGLAALALVLVAVGRTYERRAPGPYLGRAADVIDAACVVSVIPLACGVLGLFGAIRSLIG